MDRNHVYRAGIALGLFVATGCQAHKNIAKKPHAPEAVSTPDEQVTLQSTPRSDAPPDNVDALRRKAEEYAKAVETVQKQERRIAIDGGGCRKTTKCTGSPAGIG